MRTGIARVFLNELLAMQLAKDPANSHQEYSENPNRERACNEKANPLLIGPALRYLFLARMRIVILIGHCVPENTELRLG